MLEDQSCKFKAVHVTATGRASTRLTCAQKTPAGDSPLTFRSPTTESERVRRRRSTPQQPPSLIVHASGLFDRSLLSIVPVAFHFGEGPGSSAPIKIEGFLALHWPVVNICCPEESATFAHKSGNERFASP